MKESEAWTIFACKFLFLAFAIIAIGKGSIGWFIAAVWMDLSGDIAEIKYSARNNDP